MTPAQFVTEVVGMALGIVASTVMVTIVFAGGIVAAGVALLKKLVKRAA